MAGWKGIFARLKMASLFPTQRTAGPLQPGDWARILLVNKDPQDLAYYREILQKLGCYVLASSSFAEGVQCLGCEPFDLIILDQGSGRFEGQQVLAQAMEVDVELRVLVLARAYDKGCHLEAMQSGALDYLEGPLSAAEIIALLDTFMPRRSGAPRALLNRFKGAKPSKDIMSKAKSN
jgi:DNA-binding response OmpR family regulator